jgi:FkbM family methyltransferase
LSKIIQAANYVDIVEIVSLNLQVISSDFSIPPGRVIHAGASLCQERDEYVSVGFSPVIWLEALTSVSKIAERILDTYPDQRILNVALWSESNLEKTIFIASNEGQSSSFLKMKWHSFVHGSVVEIGSETHVTQSLDDVLNSNGETGPTSLLVLDLQGAELEVLKGAIDTLRETTAVFVEVALVEMYEGQPLLFDVHNFMNSKDFILVKHDLVPESMMGDALYVSKAHAETFNLTTLRVPKKSRHLYLTLLKLREDLIKIGIPIKFMRRPRGNTRKKM